MAYWGEKADENDFAFDSIGVYILLIKERMLAEMTTVREKSYPEQSIIVALKCLRLIGEQFPKALSVHFQKKDFSSAKNTFDE